MPIMGPNGPMDPGAMDAGQMANMPADGFAGATAGDMAAMPPEAMGGMNADMMGNMPPEAMGGMTADHMGAARQKLWAVWEYANAYGDDAPRSDGRYGCSNDAGNATRSDGWYDSRHDGCVPAGGYGRYGTNAYGDDAPSAMAGMDAPMMEAMPPEAMGGMGPMHMGNDASQRWLVWMHQ